MPASWRWLSFLRSRFSTQASSTGLPNTYKPLVAKGVHQADIFEPALKQFRRAFRAGEPLFEDDQQATAWRAERRRVMHHLLRLVSASSWADHLVLRGSLLLNIWLGEAAREPGDMDWVVTPASIGLHDRWAKQLFRDLIAMVAREPEIDAVRFDVDAIAIDDIWTYERAPGRRIVYPWRSAGLPAGAVQMDFVFNEQLAAEPIRVDVPQPDGGVISVRCASMEQSLAWKILWLETDSCPQGKDLYDAVLLAERVQLPFNVLRNTAEAAPGFRIADLSADSPLRWSVDWENFQREYPQVTGEAIEWQARLATALGPTFAQARR